MCFRRRQGLDYREQLGASLVVTRQARAGRQVESGSSPCRSSTAAAAFFIDFLPDRRLASGRQVRHCFERAARVRAAGYAERGVALDRTFFAPIGYREAWPNSLSKSERSESHVARSQSQHEASRDTPEAARAFDGFPISPSRQATFRERPISCSNPAARSFLSRMCMGNGTLIRTANSLGCRNPNSASGCQSWRATGWKWH